MATETSDWHWLPDLKAPAESTFSYGKAALVCCFATLAVCFWTPNIPKQKVTPPPQQMDQELECTDSFTAFLQTFREMTRGCDYSYSEKGGDRLESWMVAATLNPRARQWQRASPALALFGRGRTLSILQFDESVAPSFESLNRSKLLLRRQFSTAITPVPIGGCQEPHGNGIRYTPFSFEFGSGRYLRVTKGKQASLLRNQNEVKLLSSRFFLGCTSGTSYSNISSIPFAEFPASGVINLNVKWKDADFTDSFQVKISDYTGGFRLEPSRTVRPLPARKVPASAILWCCVQSVLGGLAILFLYKQRHSSKPTATSPVAGISRPS